METPANVGLSLAVPTFNQRQVASLILSLVLLLACCSAGLANEKRFTYKQPFSLQGIGIGANPVQGELVLRAEDEEPFVSRVLLQTIQGFHLSLPDRPQNAAEPLLPRRDYKTDMVPLGDEDVRKYNAAISPQLALDPSLDYAVQYGIRYEIHAERDRYFFIQLETFLYAKGSATPKWREYPGNKYSGDFFAGLMFDAFKNNLKLVAQSRQPTH